MSQGNFEREQAEFVRRQAWAHVIRAGEERDKGVPVYVVKMRIVDTGLMGQVIHGIEGRGWVLDKLSTHAVMDRYGTTTESLFMVFRPVDN
ncbi:hypothetical protein ACWFRM_22455 [Streptomyces sp. NPDC055144]